MVAETNIKTLEEEEKKLLGICLSSGTSNNIENVDKFLKLCKNSIRNARKRKDYDTFHVARKLLYSWSVKKSYVTGILEYKQPKSI